MKFFVPGRFCLFGEHSDWAGGYRRINSDIEKGYTLIVGTTQGIHAEVKSHPTKFIIHSTLNDGTHRGPFEVNMDVESLFKEAQKGGFFSYACGVAYQILTHYHVRGLEIDNYFTDLPVKKGLSSSAAVCVLVARAFDRIYDLKMTIRGEMEYAYQGEITTPSRCGRMDQGCAYGDRLILMTFDGDRIDVKEQRVSKYLYFVIVDLNANKNTKEILAKLNRCYPFADDEVQRNVHKYLGTINKDIIYKSVNAFQKGNAKLIGNLMKEAQTTFDRYLQPACPSQLTALVLHKVLNYGPIQKYIYGGKGIGSQGDGSAQFIVKDEKSQQKVMEIFMSDLNMNCLPLTIRTSMKIRKAIIPAAGFSTRLFPASKAIKKELFPIIDSSGKTKPVILAIVEEGVNSGIETTAIIVQDRDKKIFEDFFYTLPFTENYNKLSKDDKEYCNKLIAIGQRVTLLTQEVQEGFGHAVYCAREWVKDEPFILMLGDHLYASDNDVPCTRQLLDVYELYKTNIVGLKIIQKEELSRFGCVTGLWEDRNSILNITEIHEKPSFEYAEEHLHINEMDEDKYLALSGQYILSPKIFQLLDEHIRHNIREDGEFQLTSCLDKLRKEDGFIGYIIKGRSFDVGVPESYRQTMIDFIK